MILDFFNDHDLAYLFCEVIAAVQEVESLIDNLADKHKSQFDKKLFSKAFKNKSKIIDELVKNNISTKEQGEKLKQIIKLRNYLAHSYFVDEGKRLSNYEIQGDCHFVGTCKEDLEIAKKVIFEVNDYYSNLLEESDIKRPNIIDGNFNL